MLGGGVGFNITPEQVYSLPVVKYKPIIQRIDSNDVDFIVPDNREGWVQLLSKILKRYFYTGKDMSYSTRCIRSKGKLIKSFGGFASGSEILVKGMKSICEILDRRFGQKLRPIDCLDLMNIIGSIVVSGNIRRSSQIALGSPTDSIFLNAKNWDMHTIPNWRQMSNNSIIIKDYDEIPQEFWEGYTGNGEPYGIINLNNCKNYGRLIDGVGYRPDVKITGVNPCAEITLESYEACNLADIFLPNIHNLQEFYNAIKLMHKVCKTIATLPFIHPETENIVRKNQRIGIGVSGFMQSKWRYDTEFFNNGYNYLEHLDKTLSKDWGINPSIKLTTVKPSGTTSLLPGITPGLHPAYSPYYIRRIRMSTNDPLVAVCKKHGYHVEPNKNLDGTNSLDTMVISFPVAAGIDATCANEMSAIDQLENQKWLQTIWADNSVSCTIYFHREELYDIQQWLRKNFTKIKTCSFLLHSEHGFSQAPYEEITKDIYEEMMKKIKPITNYLDKGEYSLVDSLECSIGGCPIK